MNFHAGLAWLCVLMFGPTGAASANPVLVELFTTSGACRGCVDAEKAAARLFEEFPHDELLLHVVPVGDGDANQSIAGVIRWGFYGRPALPTIFFNGIHKISGADSRIFNTYRDNVENQINIQAAGRLYSWLEPSVSGIATSATYALARDADLTSLELFVSVTESVSSTLPPILKALESAGLIAELLGQDVVAHQFADIEPSEAISVHWFIQQNDPQRNLRDVFLASRARPQPPELQDLNLDGATDKQDYLFFSLLWGSLRNEADLNGDGVVNQLDLLLMIRK